jgi:hypothetical protein
MKSPKLSDTQRRLLSSGLQHDGLVVPPPRTAKAARAARALLRAGLVREIPTAPGELAWRRDEEGQSLALVITRAGRAATGQRRVRAKRGPAPASARPVAERLIQSFVEAHGREPRDLAELEAYIVSTVRAARRRPRH